MTKKSKNIVGQVIKNLRNLERRPMTQEQLAVKLQLHDWSISRFGVSKIERGEREVTDKELIMLAHALGVDIKELFPDS